PGAFKEVATQAAVVGGIGAAVVACGVGGCAAVASAVVSGAQLVATSKAGVAVTSAGLGVLTDPTKFRAASGFVSGLAGGLADAKSGGAPRSVPELLGSVAGKVTAAGIKGTGVLDPSREKGGRIPLPATGPLEGAAGVSGAIAERES